MSKLLSQIVAGIIGLWLAVWFVPGITLRIFSDSSFFGFPLTQVWQVIILLGVIIGLVNFFVKPILKAITLPLRILTLGLFNLVINLIIIWAVDLLFNEITIPWFWPLAWTTLIIFALSVIASKVFERKEPKMKY